ncbi:MAG: creatininase family protein [Pseudobdellovibrionaceae bacterium]|nr:creatininase family protein [Bdellovibrionales bacterium]USN46461.1 MAG: creatininase family protein [Pseudobdellovibrionaceae bacterium]
MRLENSTWPQVEKYLQEKQLIIVPVGSTEQHGPTGIFGTDYVTAQKIAEAVGDRHAVMVAPPLCFGMAEHHLAFPGTMSLRPSTYVNVIVDLIRSLRQNGFEKILFVNGHGGNIAPMTTAFSESKSLEDQTALMLINWWHLPEVREYEDQHFGDQNGFHATVGEVSVTMYTNAEAFHTIPKENFTVKKMNHPWPLSGKEFRKHFPDGRMASNPGLASEGHGRKIFDIAVDSICRKVTEIQQGHYPFK